jgi:hypothetical protein
MLPFDSESGRGFGSVFHHHMQGLGLSPGPFSWPFPRGSAPMCCGRHVQVSEAPLRARFIVKFQRIKLDVGCLILLLVMLRESVMVFGGYEG